MSPLQDVLGALRRRLSSIDETEPSAETVELAKEARGSSVTPAVLANQNGRSKRALVEYLANGERPEYVLMGNLIIIDNGDSYNTKYPTRDTQVLVSDQRVVIVLGGYLSDDLWEMSFEDIQEVYVDDEGIKDYLVVDAIRDGNPMTFFVDITVGNGKSDRRPGVKFLRERVD